MNDNPLKIIVCGFEQGGTTITEEILKSHPSLNAGFEGGFLLAKNPSKFLTLVPYSKMMAHSWRLAPKDLEYICQASNFPEAYKRLKEKSPIINEKEFLVDKTPKYMESLNKVLKRMPQIPCICVIRDPRGVCASRGGNVKATCTHINGYINGYKKAIKKSHPILTIQYEKLCVEPEKTIKIMFDFANLDYVDNWKTAQTVRGSLTTERMSVFKKKLTAGECEEVLKLTDSWSEFHWNF